MELDKQPIKLWSRLSWNCGCGALNAGWLKRCGRCGKKKPTTNI